ncbi:CopG family transcriptional regulator [Massilia sp. CCM 8733]|uniref:CopG family transcriptional regulator n=1 Tax=Massilia mucilaginosa TaxID=2609282 RepID=A0ABX0P2B5_9BURK|nr:CopG family transcriptional regulator [Massilia mucilaginosa]NHZ93443.1 CopG family transcriptional regulator [Massilia mucilaginosa]
MALSFPAHKMDLWAARRRRSRASIVEQALTAWIDREEKRSHLTRESMDDGEAGRTVDHATVQAWADSLGP